MAKQRTSLYFDDEFMAMVDDWRTARRPAPSRNAAIILMVREAFEASGIPLTTWTSPDGGSTGIKVDAVDFDEYRDRKQRGGDTR